MLGNTCVHIHTRKSQGLFNNNRPLKAGVVQMLAELMGTYLMWRMGVPFVWATSGLAGADEKLHPGT